MKPYPKNRIYVFFPALTAAAHLKGKKELARHRLDKNSVIWDYHENDADLKKIGSLPGVKLFTHDQALKEMTKKPWYKPSGLTKLNR